MPKKGEPPAVNPERLMLAYLCIREVEGLPTQVGVLDRFDLTDEEIARVCDAAVGSVRNARLIAKKQRAKKPKKEVVVRQASG